METDMSDLVELLRHPVVVLLLGALASAILVPKLSYWVKLKDTRLQKALILIKTATTVDRHLNALLTTLELFQKDSSGPAARLSDYRQEQHELRKTMMTLYLQFDRVAWWWYDNVYTEAVLLGIVARTQLSRMHTLIESYEANLIRTTEEINVLWARFLREDYNPVANENILAMRRVRATATVLEKQRRTIIRELATILAKHRHGRTERALVSSVSEQPSTTPMKPMTPDNGPT
jgi:hypothetical protein